MLHVGVNMEDSPSYQAETEAFVAQHRFQPVLNDYVRSNNVTYNDGSVRLQFQPASQRPVFVVINGISNSPTHAPWQLLINSGGYGTNDFSRQITEWRAVIDSVKAPPPRLTQPALASGRFQFVVPGQRGQTNRVEYSTNNLRNWITLTNLIGTNAQITIRDPLTNSPRRFYRVVRP